jgi:hypothetical protein
MIMPVGRPFGKAYQYLVVLICSRPCMWSDPLMCSRMVAMHESRVSILTPWSGGDFGAVWCLVQPGVWKLYSTGLSPSFCAKASPSDPLRLGISQPKPHMARRQLRTAAPEVTDSKRNGRPGEAENRVLARIRPTESEIVQVYGGRVRASLAIIDFDWGT